MPKPRRIDRRHYIFNPLGTQRGSNELQTTFNRVAFLWVAKLEVPDLGGRGEGFSAIRIIQRQR